ncbi:MAG: HD-GYP domain-containing protein [Erysipelotrichaceae bacterium]|nr:HD-GYP domain-containing protein [Erysipelotrichaceae bacterium]
MNNFEEEIYKDYVNDTLDRLSHLTLPIAIGQIILIFLDFQSGFFNKSYLNHLNLLAEIAVSISSFIVYFYCKNIKDKEVDVNTKTKTIKAYRIIIMMAILAYMFTDIYVRHKSLGAYMVFLFLLQITPAYKKEVNWLQFALFGLVTVLEYVIFVSKTLSTVFNTLAIFLCFAITTSYLRKYYIKQLENQLKAEENFRLYRNLIGHTISSLSEAVEAKDLYTKGHSQRVAVYSAKLAEKMGYSKEESDKVYFIALMHDIGKIGVPGEVINKKERLNDEEFNLIKQHPATGFEILKQIVEFPSISEGARWHHERYDGKGYPDGLKGEEIPESARIIAVADAYDAMTSNRSYRKAMSQEEVIKQIENNIGTQFDPDIARLMLELIKEDKEYTLHE